MPVMPDTRIFDLGGSSRQSSPGPFQTLGAMMKIKEGQLDFQQKERENQLKQREYEDDEVTRQYLQEHDRPEDAIDRLWHEGRGSAATRLAKNVFDERTARLQESDARVKNHQSRIEQAAQILQGVDNDASYQNARKAVLDLVQPIYGAAINDYLPTTYDAATLKKLIAAGTTRSQQLQQEHNNNTELFAMYTAGLIPASELRRRMGPTTPATPDKATAGVKSAAAGTEWQSNVSEWSPNGLEAQEKAQEMLARELTLTTNKAQWDSVLGNAYLNGYPSVVVDKFRTWDGTAPHRAKLLGLSVPQQVQAETAEGAAKIRAVQAKTAQIRAATAAATAAGGGRDLTIPQRNAEEDRRQSEDEKIDKETREEYKDTSTDYRPFEYGLMPPVLRDKYVERRLRNRDKARERLEGEAPLEEEAWAASSRGDVERFNQLKDEFAEIAKGTLSLEDWVPAPSMFRGQKSPEATAYRKNRLAQIEGELKDPKLTARGRRRLQKEIVELRAGRR